jgi:NAD/NADP transhydrogenase alpha subunit
MAQQTVKEKAEELVNKFLDVDDMGRMSNGGYSVFSTELLNRQAKQCALIAVDEIINIGCIEVPYWQQVKTEIEKL